MVKRRRGRPEIAAREPDGSTVVQVRIPRPLRERLEKYRALQLVERGETPSFAEALRELSHRGLVVLGVAA